MPRVRLRLGTLALLIVIIALVVALFVQQRRESVLHARLRAVEDETEWERLRFRRLEASRQKQLNELRSHADHLRRGEPEREQANDHRK